VYEFLEGLIVTRKATGLVLEVGGVGYSLATPLGSRLPDVGTTARVHVHLVVRDDAHVLFGFGSREERDLFRLLLKVRGIGPSMGLALLSALNRTEIVQALLNRDAAPFTRAKGVGRKTAEQIVLDLADRAEEFAAGCELEPGVLKPSTRGPIDRCVLDATSALVSIGYAEKDARKRVEAAAEKYGSDDLEELVRAAIRR
jgi:Holliday junction DNA helicase RuvA